MFEGVIESDNAINWNLRHGLRLRETQIDRDAAPTFRTGFSLSPIGHAAARKTEVKLGPPRYVGLGCAGHTDAFAFESICPKHTIAATDGAITRFG